MIFILFPNQGGCSLMGFITNDLLNWLLRMFCKVITGRSHPVNLSGKLLWWDTSCVQWKKPCMLSEESEIGSLSHERRHISSKAGVFRSQSADENFLFCFHWISLGNKEFRCKEICTHRFLLLSLSAARMDRFSEAPVIPGAKHSLVTAATVNLQLLMHV